MTVGPMTPESNLYPLTGSCESSIFENNCVVVLATEGLGFLLSCNHNQWKCFKACRTAEIHVLLTFWRQKALYTWRNKYTQLF